MKKTNEQIIKTITDLYARGKEFREIATMVHRAPETVKRILCRDGLTDREIKSKYHNTVVELSKSSNLSPEDISRKFGIKVEIVNHWINAIDRKEPTYEVLFDPSSAIDGTRLSQCEVDAMLIIGNFSDGTILKELSSKKQYKIHTVSRMVEYTTTTKRKKDDDKS